MKIRIPIPRWLWRLSDRFGDWANVTLWQRGRLELRRVDVLVAIAFVFGVGYHFAMSGWYQALLSGVLFVFLLMIRFWMF